MADPAKDDEGLTDAERVQKLAQEDYDFRVWQDPGMATHGRAHDPVGKPKLDPLSPEEVERLLKKAEGDHGTDGG